MKFFTKTISYALPLLCFFILPAITSAGVVTRPPLSLGLAAYWSFEGTSGSSSIIDYSGNGNTGVMTSMDAGSDYVTGYNGASTALDFDGSNDRVVFPNSSSIDITDAVTVSFWVNKTSHIDWSGLVYMANTGTDIGGSFSQYGLYITNESKIATNFGNGSGAGGSYSTTVLSNSVWYHVAATYDSAGSIYLYINGQQEGSSSSPGGLNSDSYSLELGHDIRFPVAQRHFNGKLDEVRIFNRVLSPSEISNLYTNTANARVQSHDKSNLVGYWSFEDATGTTATDFSGNGNTGTLTNMDANTDWIKGKAGKALDFDGTDDYVTVPQTANLDGFSQFTISAWIKQDSSKDAAFLSTKNSNNSGPYYVWINGNGSITFFASAVNANNRYSYITTNTTGLITYGAWHHVVAVFNGSTDLTVYVDGVSYTGTYGSAGSAFSSVVDTSIPILIGTYSTYGPDAGIEFNGKIDEVRIYSSALTATQIKNLYQNSKYTQVNTPQNNKLTDGLVGYWTFNGQDMTSTTALDVSGNGNNGTLANSPQTTIGKVGQGIKFDGVNDYIQIPSNLSLTTGDFTINTWLKYGPGGGNSREIFSMYIDPGQLLLYMEGGDDFLYFYMEDTDGDTISVVDTTERTDNEWHMVSVMREGTTIKFFLDGVSVGTNDASSIDTLPNCTSLFIGAIDYGGGCGTSPSSFFYDGYMDEFRVYDRALTSTEVTRLYNLGR